MLIFNELYLYLRKEKGGILVVKPPLFNKKMIFEMAEITKSNRVLQQDGVKKYAKFSLSIV